MRISNYLAGGGAHFAADREAIEKASEVLPEGVEVARLALRILTAFQARVVRHLVVEAGVTQLLKVGAVAPAGDDVHEVAQALAPATRVVHVGNDPTVLAYAHTFRGAGPDGVTAYVHGSVLQVDDVLDQVAETLDLDRPIGLLLPMTLPFVADAHDPWAVVGQFVDALASGSYLAITHSSSQGRSGCLQESVDRFGKLVDGAFTLRSRAEITRFFAGLDLVEPGVVQVDDWRPGPDPSPERGGEPGRTGPAGAGTPLPIDGGVARKP